MDGITKRFLKFLDHLKTTKQIKNATEFAAKIGISNSMITEMKNGRSDVGPKSIAQLIQHFTTINCNWLFYGTGHMLVQGNNNEPLRVTVNPDGRDNCAYVNVKARAGYLTGYGDTEFITALPTGHLPHLPRGNYRMFEVEGDSMFPTLKDKDIVICRFLSRSNIKNNQLCVVACTQGVLVKRVFNRVEEAGELILKSDNQEIAGVNPDQHIPADEVMEIWQVIKYIGDPLQDVNDPNIIISELRAHIDRLENQLSLTINTR